MSTTRTPQKHAKKGSAKAHQAPKPKSLLQEKWVQIFLLILSLGLVSTGYFHFKKSSLKNDELDLELDSSHEVIPACQADGDLVSCITQICDEVHDAITPFNRDAEG